MDFETLLAPISRERFLAEYYGRAPLHIPAPAGGEGERGRMFGWNDLNGLLAIQRHWSSENIRVMRDGTAVAPKLYMEEVVAQEGAIQRASPAKLDVLLSLGASLVAQSVQQISPELRALCAMLADELRGRATANIYCSFKGVAALPVHFDSHEVFALHCEGEKVWRIHDCPADRPIYGKNYHEGPLVGKREPEPVLTVRMAPGDLLYIPRGFRHDALASAGESLHITFSLDPLNGGALFRPLKELALHDSAFRDYLADARAEGGAALRKQLDVLAERLADLVRSEAMFDEIATEQQKLARRPYFQALPARPQLTFYMRSKAEAAVRRRPEGAAIVTEEGMLPVGQLREEAEWILSHPLFSLEELAGNFPHHDGEALRDLLDRLEAAGIVRKAQVR